MVKNPPAKQETWVRSLGWEDPLEKGMATLSMDRGTWRATVHGVTELDTTERLNNNYCNMHPRNDKSKTLKDN